MRFATAALAIVMVFAFCPAVHAKGGKAKNGGADTSAGGGDKSLTGTIVSVSGASLTVSVTTKKGKSKERHVKTNEKTKITLDGKEAKLSDLKKDEQVSVTLEHGTASEVSATSATSNGSPNTGAGGATTK